MLTIAASPVFDLGEGSPLCRIVLRAETFVRDGGIALSKFVTHKQFVYSNGSVAYEYGSYFPLCDDGEYDAMLTKANASFLKRMQEAERDYKLAGLDTTARFHLAVERFNFKELQDALADLRQMRLEAKAAAQLAHQGPPTEDE